VVYNSPWTLVLDPFLTIDEDNTTFGISVGVVR
jgi:hypothetical protein